MKKCFLPILLLLSAIASNAEQIIIRDVKELIELRPTGPRPQNS
jgi:hypothetical protein